MSRARSDGKEGPMASDQVVWIETEICTGCGACVDVCPAGALTLVDQVALVDEERCTGCDACIDACPQDAIHPVVVGEIVLAEEGRVQVREEEGRLAHAMDRYRPLAETVGPALAVAGAGLLAKAARAVTTAVTRWLMSPEDESQLTRSAGPGEHITGLGSNGGRRTRRRRRGR